MIADNLVTENCARKRLLYNGQFRCRKRQLIINEFGRLMIQVDDMKKMGNHITVLLLDLMGMSLHMASGNLI